jgi:hypothetical protein
VGFDGVDAGEAAGAAVGAEEGAEGVPSGNRGFDADIAGADVDVASVGLVRRRLGAPLDGIVVDKLGVATFFGVPLRSLKQFGQLEFRETISNKPQCFHPFCF